ncbi:MAG: TonB-dependent hemoglobin/transferrin/lactoferrin family receptor [Cyanobacteria bacterium]|nr:TonB-dependent hemoglobin/transferrin/lactoferrin family receptor [Cyanobacteriota bacterium]MDW8202107.1 TonB-dependent hemoglobin/transferrin/lactoferrin family receptor [Cyanobacteriota bacterium SKYGB_h_bin112]
MNSYILMFKGAAWALCGFSIAILLQARYATAETSSQQTDTQLTSRPNLSPPTALPLPSSPIPTLQDYQAAISGSESRPATTLQEWRSQIDAVTVQVTKISVQRNNQELEITLDTADNKPLTVDASKFRAEGNDLIADIPNAVLALPDGQTFRVENPADDIARVVVTQMMGNRIQIVVTGKSGLPTSEVVLKTGGLAYSLNADIADAGEALPEEEITITGTRTPRPVRLTPGSISVIDAETIDQQLVRDLRDLVRYEPNVSVGNNRRYGLQDINIRGLGGNRVLILNDGVRVPNQFQFGTPSLGRDYVDIESLQRLEIIRGPASALYGSDALGGVVNFRTVEPSDLLDRFQRNSISSLSVNLETVDGSWVNTGITAFRVGAIEGLLNFTRRDGQESRVPVGNEFVDDRFSGRNNLLGKLIYRFDQTSSLQFTTEAFRTDDDFTVAPITAANLLGPAGFQGRDETLRATTYRDRFSLGYVFDDPKSQGFLSGARIQVYYQSAGVNESRVQDFLRTGAGVDRRRLRNLNNSFIDRVVGGEVQLQSTFNLGTVANRLTYGFDISSTRNERVRNGLETQFNAAGNPILTTNVIGPDNFPVKDFPDSDTFRLGIYLQNEITLSDTLTLIPGLRFDYYNLDAQIDALYLRNSPDVVASDFSDSALSPNLGIVWQASPEITIVGRYARGFRSPLYSEINSGFTNLASPFFRYKTLSNPNLRPETSDTFELGVRGRFPQGSFSLTGFYSSYNNFIETFAAAGTTFIGGNLVNLFQSQNIGQARTYGLEFGGEYRFSPEPHGFSLLASLGWTVGDDLIRNQPLESVDPLRAVIGLRYRAPENLWGAELITSFVADPRLRSDRPPGSYTPSGYTVLDLVGYYNITPLLTLNVGIFNLLNSQYFLYSDVRPLLNSPTPADISRFAQPSISLRAGLTWRF